MAIDKLPGVYYNEDITYELNGVGSKIPIFIGVSGNRASYTFTSYSNAKKKAKYGTGRVKETGVVNNNYTEVEVLTNLPDKTFVGNTYFIESDAKTDGETAYELFTDAGTTSANIFVTIQEEYVVNGTKALQFEHYTEINQLIEDGGIGVETTTQVVLGDDGMPVIDESTGKYKEEIINHLSENPLLKRLKEFYEESRLLTSGDIGVPHVYVIDVGKGNSLSVWKEAIKTAKSLHDATVEFYIGATVKEETVDGVTVRKSVLPCTITVKNETKDVELSDFMNMVYTGLDDTDEDYGLEDCAKNLDLRYAFTTITGVSDKEIIDTDLINFTNVCKHSRIGLIEPLLAGKTVARICCTPNNTEPGYYAYRSVVEDTFHPRTKHDMLKLQNNGVIFNRDEHINGNIYPKINLCVATSFADSSHRPADALFHARFNADSLLRDVFEACYNQVKNNESATNIAYLQTRINKLVNDRVTAEEMVKYNDKEDSGTKLYVAESDSNPYNIIVYGQIQPVKCTIAIDVRATIKI